MSWKAVLIAASITPLAGCRLFENAARNIVNEPIEYLDERKVSHEARADAERMWLELCAANPSQSFTKDYAAGFRDGYADYLDNGGPGVPPALPPRHYRRSNYLNPEGHALIRDWFAGFQQGIDIAMETGKRGYLTVPVLLPEPPTSPTLNVKQVPTEECAPKGNDLRKGSEKLPTPRPVEPMTGLPAPERPVEPKVAPAPAPAIPPLNPTPEPIPPPPPSVPKADASPAAPLLPKRIAPAADNVPLTANQSDSLGSGKYEVSPVSEGLRVIVRPVRDSR